MRRRRPLYGVGAPLGAALLVMSAGCSQPPPVSTDVELPPPSLAAADAGTFGEPVRQVYLPVHALVKRRDRHSDVALSINLIVRNTDEQNAIRIDSVRSYAASGRLVREHLGGPIVVPKMAVHQIVTAEQVNEVDAAASFLVEWTAGAPVHEPVVEALMVGSYASRGLSFRSVGRALGPRDSSVNPNIPLNSIE